MASYLVTGGCGFIGSHLVERLLKQGHKVTVLDNLSSGKKENIPSDVELIQEDVCRIPQLKSILKDIDGCFHLAAVVSVEQSVHEWHATHQINQSATVALFEAIKKTSKPIPVVYASSAAVYGANNNLPLKETEQALPLTPYGVDKYGCELHAKIAANLYNIPNAGLRFFNVYGPRQDPSSPYAGVVSIFYKLIAAGKSITIFGQGDETRDFVYVSDVAQALTDSMEYLHKSLKSTSEIFNVATGKGTTVKQLAEKIEKLYGVNVEHCHEDKRRGNVHESIADISKIENMCGYKANVSLSNGLLMYRDYLNKVKKITEK